MVSTLDELTKDIETDRTAEKIAYEAVVEAEGMFPGAVLSKIEETSPGLESLVSRVAVARQKEFTDAFIAQIQASVQRITNPALENQRRANRIQPSFKQVDSTNHQACRRLLANIPAPSADEDTSPAGDASPGEDTRRTRRILKELEKWSGEALSDWFTISPVSETNLDKFIGTFRGPAGTPYEGGTFHICFEPTERYPYQPPKVWFLMKIVHPNIDWQGTVLMDILAKA